MKKRFLHYLLAIVGVVLLIGLITSCGESPEPRFKIIESKEYTTENAQALMNALYDKHLNGKTSMPSATARPIMDSYWENDLRPLIDAEMKNKLPTVGLIIVLKVDTLYKAIGSCYWNKNGGWTYTWWLYNN